MTKQKIQVFTLAKEEAEFWDTHDTGDLKMNFNQ
jgi:hypothetical protein